jgi:hypothetical protein
VLINVTYYLNAIEMTNKVTATLSFFHLLFFLEFRAVVSAWHYE